MTPTRSFLEFCAARGGVLLALSIFAGLLVPPAAAAMRGAVTPVVALLMTLVLLRVDPAQVLGYLRRPALVAALLGWLLVCCPLLVWAVTRLPGLDGPWTAAAVILATGCAATSSPAFARLVGLDGEVALVVSLLSTLLVPFTAPPLALVLLGLDLSIPPAALTLRLALLVGLPLVLSVALRRLLGPAVLARWGRAVDGAVVLLVVFYGIGVMDGVLAQLLAAPVFVLGGIATAFAVTLGLNAATAAAFLPAGRALGLSAGLLSGNRNMALYLAVLPAGTDPAVLLFLVLCQFPLFLSPFVLRPVYGALSRGRPG